ncbi:hydrolase [Mangrovimonas spongiae]|nr:hydrolase [Mangrovimonas spongiae]
MMKQRIFMYLFIFTLLFVVFQYVNSKKILEEYESKISTYEEKVSTLEQNLVDNQEMIAQLEERTFNMAQFSLEDSDAAMTYFEDQGYRISDLVPFIKDQLYETNFAERDNHPIVPYAPMTDGKMMIDAIRILNHKWIIANFSDGKYWGELLISYEITAEKELKFELIKSFLYVSNI